MKPQHPKFLKRVRFFRKLMSVHDWVLQPVFKKLKKGPANMVPFWQYRETTLTVDKRKLPKRGWERDDLILHELGHLKVAPLASFARILCRGDKVLGKILEEIEDHVVTDIARMKIWESVTPEAHD